MAVIVAGQRELSEKLRKLVQMVHGAQRLQALMAGGLVLEREMKKNVNKHHLIDTGNLRASITAESEGGDAVTVGPRNVRYAAIHEFGGRITPKNARALAIPMTKEAKAAGSPKNFPGGLRLVVRRGKARLVTTEKRGKTQYVLVRYVNIPAKPYVRPALDEHGDTAMWAIGHAVREMLREVEE